MTIKKSVSNIFYRSSLILLMFSIAIYPVCFLMLQLNFFNPVILMAFIK